MSGRNGKGDKRRPTKVDDDTFASNWDRIFGSKKETESVCPYCDQPSTSVTSEAIDYCAECDLIIEGMTITKEIEE